MCMITRRMSGRNGCCGTRSRQRLGLLLEVKELGVECGEGWEEEEPGVEDVEEEVREGSGMRKRKEDHKPRWFSQVRTSMEQEKEIFASV